MTTFNTCASLEPNSDSQPAPPPIAASNESSSAVNDDNRLLKIKKLKARLINEEHRLVLMKKIRQSQTRPINPQQQQQQQSANALNSGLNAHSAHLKKIRSSQGGPLSMHKSHQLGPSSSSTSSSLSSALSSSALAANSSSAAAALNQTPAHAHQRPKVNTLWNPPQQVRHPTPVGIAPPHVGNLSRQPITTPPNVVQAMMGNLSSGSQSLLMNQINAAAAAAARRPQSSLNNNNPNNNNNNNILNQSNSNSKMAQAAQLLLQSKQRTSLKPSLQKQLENTLLPQSTKHGQSSGLSFNSANLTNTNRRMVGVTSPHVGNLSRQPITTPPNVVQDMRGGQQSLLMNSNSLSNLIRNNRNSQQLQHQTSFNKSQGASGTGGSSSMLLQKRTAAKAAIQRQLEQTLMQLPSKQLHLGIDFIPNANNIEFVYYVGLEACVDYLTNTKNPLDLQPLEKPLECSTCGTDFTPAWSWKRSNAVCESCVSNHVKKSIKNSQASRIKSVLAKAAKQEQEMDQRILAEANNPTSQSSPTTSSHQHQPHSLLQPSQSHHLHTQQRSSPQVWPRLSQSSPLNVVSSNNNNNRGATTTTTPAGIQPVLNANPLASLQPAIASLLQMNPQISTLASLMTANTPSTTNNTGTTNTNQFAQVAALLMNQLTMNMFKR